MSLSTGCVTPKVPWLCYPCLCTSSWGLLLYNVQIFVSLRLLTSLCETINKENNDVGLLAWQILSMSLFSFLLIPHETFYFRLFQGEVTKRLHSQKRGKWLWPQFAHLLFFLTSQICCHVWSVISCQKITVSEVGLEFISPLKSSFPWALHLQSTELLVLQYLLSHGPFMQHQAVSILHILVMSWCNIQHWL